MNMMNLRSFNPPQPSKKLTPRDVLDELVRSGYRPYICGDVGFGIVIVWATSVYVEAKVVGEPGFAPETWGRWDIPTRGLVPDVEASVQRVADALGCDTLRRSTIDVSLEYLISSSVMLTTNDLGEVLFKPLLEPVEARS